MDVFFLFVLALLSFLTQILLIKLSGFLPPPVILFHLHNFLTGSMDGKTGRLNRGWIHGTGCAFASYQYRSSVNEGFQRRPSILNIHSKLSVNPLLRAQTHTHSTVTHRTC